MERGMPPLRRCRDLVGSLQAVIGEEGANIVLGDGRLSPAACGISDRDSARPSGDRPLKERLTAPAYLARCLTRVMTHRRPPTTPCAGAAFFERSLPRRLREEGKGSRFHVPPCSTNQSD